MGLLTDVLLLPITGPVRGLRFIAEQVKEQADAELDPRRRAEQIQAELIRLSVQRDLGQISDDDYVAREAALLEQLNALQAGTEDVDGSWQRLRQQRVAKGKDELQQNVTEAIPSALKGGRQLGRPLVGRPPSARPPPTLGAATISQVRLSLALCSTAHVARMAKRCKA